MKQSQQRSGKRRWLPWLLALALLLALPAGLAWWLLDPATVLAILRQSVRETAGLELGSQGDVRLHVLPAPRLALRDVTLEDLYGRGLASIGRIDVELPWHSLWTRPPPLGRVVLADIDLQAGSALEDWLALWSAGPPQPRLAWPRLERGLSLRRLRYYAAPPVDADPAADPTAATTIRPLFEIESIELDPVASGAPLLLDLSVQASQHRLALQLRARADDSSGSLRVAAGSLAVAFGPLEQDEALRLEGSLDLSLLAAGGLRGEADLTLAELAWVGAMLGLPLAGPAQLRLDLTQSDPMQSDIALQLLGSGVDASALWPLGPDSESRPAWLQLDYEGSDGLKLQGLRLQRELPATTDAATATTDGGMP